MAPKQPEPPFVVAQLVAMALFVVLGIKTVKKFRAESVHTVARAGATQS
jgi:hypothetical protein